MSFINDFKKIFFGAKAVSKSAADKAADKAADAGDKAFTAAEDLFDAAKDKATKVGGDTYNSAEELFDDVKDKAADMSSTVIEKASDLFGKAKETAGDLTKNVRESEEFAKAKDFTENVGDKVLDTGEDFMNKAKEVSESVGEKVLDKGGKIADHMKGVFEEEGGKLKDKAEDLYNKAQEEAAKENIDDSVDRITRMEQDMAERVKKRDQTGAFGDDSSLLDGKDDFFERAARFAEGDYHGTGKVTVDPTPTPPVDDPDVLELLPLNTEDTPTEKTPFTGEIKGFTDADGDGDPVIDDAVVIEDEDTDQSTDEDKKEDDKKDPELDVIG